MASGVQGGTESMLGYLEQAKDHDVAVSAMWIQDWSGKITTDFGTRGRLYSQILM